MKIQKKIKLIQITKAFLKYLQKHNDYRRQAAK